MTINDTITVGTATTTYIIHGSEFFPPGENNQPYGIGYGLCVFLVLFFLAFLFR